MITFQSNSEKVFLKNSIEYLRKEMIRVGIQEGLTSKKTIHISQILDTYLTRYQIFEQ